MDQYLQPELIAMLTQNKAPHGYTVDEVREIIEWDCRWRDHLRNSFNKVPNGVCPPLTTGHCEVVMDIAETGRLVAVLKTQNWKRVRTTRDNRGVVFQIWRLDGVRGGVDRTVGRNKAKATRHQSP